MQCLRCGVHRFVAGSCRWRRGPRRRRRVGWVPKYAAPHRGGPANAGLLKGPRFGCVERGTRGGGPSARATAVLRRSRSCSGPSCATRRGLRRCWIRTRRPTRPPTVIAETAVPTRVQHDELVRSGQYQCGLGRDQRLPPRPTHHGRRLGRNRKFFAGRLMHPRAGHGVVATQTPSQSPVENRRAAGRSGWTSISHRLAAAFPSSPTHPSRAF